MTHINLRSLRNFMLSDEARVGHRWKFSNNAAGAI